MFEELYADTYVKDRISGDLVFLTWISPEYTEVDALYPNAPYVCFSMPASRYRNVRGWQTVLSS